MYNKARGRQCQAVGKIYEALIFIASAEPCMLPFSMLGGFVHPRLPFDMQTVVLERGLDNSKGLLALNDF
jgi:hypothetical protein